MVVFKQKSEVTVVHGYKGLKCTHKMPCDVNVMGPAVVPLRKHSVLSPL